MSIILMEYMIMTGQGNLDDHVVELGVSAMAVDGYLFESRSRAGYLTFLGKS